MAVPTPTMPGVGHTELLYRGQALAQLRILKQQMSLGKLKIGSRTVTIAAGVVVHCNICFNNETVQVIITNIDGTTTTTTTTTTTSTTSTTTTTTSTTSTTTTSTTTTEPTTTVNPTDPYNWVYFNPTGVWDPPHHPIYPDYELFEDLIVDGGKSWSHKYSYEDDWVQETNGVFRVSIVAKYHTTVPGRARIESVGTRGEVPTQRSVTWLYVDALIRGEWVQVHAGEYVQSNGDMQAAFPYSTYEWL